MQLNMALFEFNGRTGYLLKHDVMRRSDKKFDPFCDRIDTVVASTLTIKAGSQPCYYSLSYFSHECSVFSTGVLLSVGTDVENAERKCKLKKSK